MNIVVPMAGHGFRFANRGYNLPKPLIPVAGRPMVAWALKSVEHIPNKKIVFVALQEHEKSFAITSLLKNLVSSRVEVILIPDVTEGQLCTVLEAHDLINTEEDMLIASSDTYIVSNLAQDIAAGPPDCRGIISVANLPGDRWSFARTDETGRVVDVAEKIRISDYASTGLYYFSSGREFVAIGEKMVGRAEKTLGEYYVIPVYRKYIRQGWRVDISIACEIWDMGTPEALIQFEKHQSDINQV